VNRSDEKAGLENGDAFILVQRKNNNTHSTPTGLLREGDYTQNPSMSVMGMLRHRGMRRAGELLHK
jgi:hypothetical protein